MNSELRKAINVRNMLRRKYDKCNILSNWAKYRNQRNYVSKLRKRSKSHYMKEICMSNNNNDNFWNVVKPLMSDKFKGSNANVILNEKGSIVNNAVSVGDIFNNHYINATKHIGKPDGIDQHNTFGEIIHTHKGDDCINFIKNNLSSPDTFCFSSVSENQILGKLKMINVKKAAGYDNIPPKLIKIGAEILCTPICSLVNKSIDMCSFPCLLKCAEVTLVYKKDDVMDKQNYRPVSVLPCLSKVFESVLIDQMRTFMEPLFSPYLSGFRKSHSCQSVLVRFIEKKKLWMKIWYVELY